MKAGGKSQKSIEVIPLRTRLADAARGTGQKQIFLKSQSERNSKQLGGRKGTRVIPK